MVSKKAVFDYADQDRIRDACETDKERVIVMLMLNFGMHPKNVVNLGPSHLDDGWLHYARAKNARPMDFLIPKDMLVPLRNFLKRHPRSERRYNQIVHEIGSRIGMPELSPMSLRHTTCINVYREKGCDIYFTAMWMGCTREIVSKNYMMLSQWEDALSPRKRTEYEDEIQTRQRAKERG